MYKKDQKGFTIIEVLIVLAIAALIMLIVFLAIPALQRNQRNTARKNDIARITGAFQEYISNNNGKFPSASGQVSAVYSSAGDLAQFAGLAPVYVSGNTVTNMAPGDFTIAKNDGDFTPGNIPKNSDHAVRIVLSGKCNSANNGTVSASTRQAAVLYTVESGNNPNYAIVCQDI